MEPYLSEKLASEIEKYQDKDFLKAVMAAFVLIAYADGRMAVVERCHIDETLTTEPSLREFDFQKATEILESYASALQDEGESAKIVLYDKVRRMAGNHKRARTLMRVCYLVVQADDRIDEGEIQVFRQLCGLLRLEPTEVWRTSWNSWPQVCPLRTGHFARPAGVQIAEMGPIDSPRNRSLWVKSGSQAWASECPLLG